MTLRSCLLFLAVLGSTTGCRQRHHAPTAADDAAPPAPTMPRTQVVALEQPEALLPDDTPLPAFDGIELADRGQAPRHRLRYRLADLAPCSFTVATRVAVDQVIDSHLEPAVELPEIRYGLGFSSARKGRDSVTLDLFGRRAEIAGPKPESADAASLAEDQVTSFRSFVERRRGSAVVRDRGVLGAITIADPDPEAKTGRSKQEIAQILLQALVPLPERSVGAGARWRTRYRLRRGAHVVAQKATYQLLEVTGTKLRIRAEIEQLGEPQWVPPGYLPRGSSAELILLRWRAEGELAVDLAVPTPVTGKLTVLLTNHGRVISDGNRHDLFSEVQGQLELATE